GAARRMADVLVRRLRTLGVVAVEQSLRRLAGEHQPELPRQVVRVLDAGVRAARAERRNQVRRIAGEQHAAATERAHAPALKRIDARPLALTARLVAPPPPDPSNDA